MQIQWQGDTLTLDIEGISNRHAMAIQKFTGLTVMDLLEGLDTINPKAMLAIFWLAHEQSGKRIDINQADFGTIEFMKAIRDALRAEQPDEDESDPKDDEDFGISAPTSTES
jgi:hypothetical protein